MACEKMENKKLDLIPSTFEFHDFLAQVGEVRICCRVMKMADSLYVWIGNSNDSKMSDLTVAMISTYEKLPVSTKLLGSTEDTTSTSLAKRLAKKCGKPVYVSFNIPVNSASLPAIEKAIQEQWQTKKELFAF